MRLFTGISVQFSTQTWFEMRQGIPLKWTPDENLHITTKFIGEWPEARLAELKNELSRVSPPGILPITVSEVGFLPRIFYAGVHGGSGLENLARDTDEALETLGCKRETRPYLPHVTLARIGVGDVHVLQQRIACVKSLLFGSWEATEFHLFVSRSSVYSKLASYPLA